MSQHEYVALPPLKTFHRIRIKVPTPALPRNHPGQWRDYRCEVRIDRSACTYLARVRRAGKITIIHVTDSYWTHAGALAAAMDWCQGDLT